MLTAIRQWVTKTMLKSKGQTGVVQTLPKKELIEINTQITAQRLLQNGIDPNSLKNSDQVENAIIAIESRPAVQQGIKSTPEAKVFDMEGKEIKNPDNIMGGKEVEADLPPPGSRGGPDDIAAPFASQEETMTNIVKDELMKTDNPFSDLVKTTEKGPKSLREREAEVLAGMEKNNKEAVQRIKNRKMVEDAVDNASPGFVKGDRKYNAQMVAEDLADKRFGKEFYDLDQRQQMDIYDEALEGYDEITRGMPDPEDFAQGGRAGYFLGGSSKAGKAFLEFMKKFKVKQSGDDLKDFLSKRKFLKDMVGNTEKNKRTRELNMLKEAMEKARKEGGYKFKDIDVDKDIRPIFDQSKDRKLNATGGRAGFRSGSGKGIMEFFKNMMKPKKPKGFDERRFREGPIDLKFLDNLESKDLEKFIRTRDTMGPGGYGMYDDFADMPAGLRAAELISTIKGPANKINYRAAELFLGKKLRGDETVDELLQVLNRQEMRADGGRIGYKDGPDMGRRNFLKIMGGFAAIPIVGKFFKVAKAGKTVTKVPIIKTGDVPGKPEWFDALVNKVILEGDDVTKKFATKEREIVHMKKIDDETSVMVTQDLNDGSIMVDVDDPIRNVMGEGAGLETDTKVQMMLKKGQADETTKGTPPDEFSFTENDMRNYMDGPDDYTTEFTENTVDKMKDLTSDLGKIKSYATGEGPTMKQIVESKKRKDMVKFAEKKPAEYAADRGPDIDTKDYDYASGGIARMLGE